MAFHHPTGSSSPQTLHDNDTDWTTPLLQSTLAGLSTCLGAAIVFCTRRPVVNGKQRNGSGRSGGGLGHEHLAFALSLAGSVMITVSVASILPECFAVDNDVGDLKGADGTPSTIHYLYTPIGSPLFWERCIAFGIGCALYLLLSKCAFPEPDAVLGLTSDSDAHTTTSLSLVQSSSFEESTAPLSPRSNTAGNSSTASYRKTRTHHRNHASDSELFPLTSNGTLMRHNEEISISSSFGPLTNACMVEGGTSSTGNTPLKRFVAPHESFKKATGPGQRHCCGSLGASARQCLHWMRGNDLTSSAAAAVPLGSTNHPSLDGTVAAALEARRAWRVAMLLFLSLTVHNFPEGLAVAASSLQSARLGWTTTVAIALHNIPEGIAIAIPCLAARPDAPWLAFGLASASGLAEPLGAAVALLVLRGGGGGGRGHQQRPVPIGHDKSGTNNISAVTSATVLDDASNNSVWNVVLHMKNVLAFVAGIMIAVALVELFPEARRHIQTRTARWSFVAGTLTGILVMLASDAYLES
jgi:zinc transporter, ZIP family